MSNKSRIIKLILGCLAFSLLTSACGQHSNKPKVQQQSTQNGQQSEKIPDTLKELENNIEKVIQALNGPAKKIEEENKGKGKESTSDSQSKNKQSNTGEQNKQQSSANEGTQKKQSGQQSQNTQQNTQQNEQQQEDPWKKATGIIENIHFQWNSYMNEAVKKGASSTLIDNFSTALNDLTTASTGKNQLNTLLAANKVYLYIPDFANLYKTTVSPEIKRVRYFLRNCILESMSGNWPQVASDLNNLKSTWSIYKNAAPNEQQDLANKLDFSIREFDKVASSKNQQLVQLKGKVAMSSTDELEKALDEAQKKNAK